MNATSRCRAAWENSQKVISRRSLLIPYKQSGEIDWSTLGNILTAAIVGEVLCASYVDVKHRMAKPNFEVDTDWKYAYEENDVVILRKQFQDSPFLCWMGRTVIERPKKEIAAFLQDPESAYIFDKYIVESRYIQELSESKSHKDVIGYYRTEARECLLTAKRDFVFFLHKKHIDDKCVLTALSVDHPECPPLEGIPRAQIQPGSGWHLEPHLGSDQRTLVSYVAHVDLVGLPPIIANRVLKRQPMNIFYIKKHLMARKEATIPSSLPLTEEEKLQRSGHHFEDALPVYSFMKEESSGRRRMASDPKIPTWQCAPHQGPGLLYTTRPTHNLPTINEN